LVAHNLQNRKIAIIENGSWAIASGKLMKEQFDKCKDIEILGNITIKSAVKQDILVEIEKLADKILATF